MRLSSAWSSLHEQHSSFKGSDYSVAEILDMAEGLDVQEAPVDAFAMDYDSPCDDSLISFAQHMKQVSEAKLRFPIILSPCGVIVDGRHRLIKAMVKGKKTIKFKRLEVMPQAITGGDK